MMDKKAIMRLTLMKLVIGIITLAILLFLTVDVVYPFIFSSTTKEACRTSVLLRSWTLEKEPGVTEVVFRANPLNCKTEYKCLTNKGECPDKYQKINVGDDEDMKAEIAGSIYDCWWMLGEGRALFVGDWEGQKPLGSDVRCVICSVIDFDDKLKFQGKIEGLNKYMAETFVPGKNITYLQYLTYNITASARADDGTTDAISTSQKLAVVFMQGRYTAVKRVWVDTVKWAGVGTGVGLFFAWTGVGPAIGWGTGGLIGATVGVFNAFFLSNPESVTSLMLVPYNAEEITKSCGVLESIP